MSGEKVVQVKSFAVEGGDLEGNDDIMNTFLVDLAERGIPHEDIRVLMTESGGGGEGGFHSRVVLVVYREATP